MTKSTGERMAVIETDIKNIKKSIEDHVDNQREDFDTVFKKLDALSGRFAGKWVENVSIGVLVSVVAGIAVGIILFMINRGG